MKLLFAILLLCLCTACETRRGWDVDVKVAPLPPSSNFAPAILFIGTREDAPQWRFCILLPESHQELIMSVPPPRQGTPFGGLAVHDFSDAFLVPDTIDAISFFKIPEQDRAKMPGVIRLNGSMTIDWKAPQSNPEKIAFNLKAQNVEVTGHFKWMEWLALNGQAYTALTWPFLWVEVFGPEGPFAAKPDK